MNNLLDRTRKIYNEYPRAFWIYNIIIFIDRLGGFMLYPFFALYLTQKFEIGMSTVGIVFAVFSVSGFIGSALGGALTDRMGRKGVIIFSLILSSLSALGMGFAPTLAIFVAVSVIVGTLANIGGPAHEAVGADLLPPEKRAEGYGIIRVIFNMAVIVAPALAGLLIARSYILLFIVDAVISLISAGIVLFVLPETKPQAHAHAKPETMKQTFAGYGRVFKDVPFITFISVTITAGSLLYAIGFAMYGIVSTYAYFVVAMVIITVGEMIVSPFQQALVAGFAPEQMRGRYMAVSGLSWGIAFAIGPYFAGLILDSAHPNLLWAMCGLLGVLASISFTVLNRIHHSDARVPEPAAAD